MKGKKSNSDLYVPSDALVQEIESGGDALAVCKDLRDSFYVDLLEAEKFLTLKDSIQVKRKIETLNKKVGTLNSENLLARFNLLMGKQSQSFLNRIEYLKEASTYAIRSNDSELDNSIYYLSLAYLESDELDSCIKYSTILDSKDSSGISELSLSNKELLRIAFKNKLMFSESMKLVDQKISIFKNRESADSFGFAKAYYDKAALNYDLHEIDLASKLYKKALMFLPREEQGKILEKNMLTDYALMQINDLNFTGADSTLNKLKTLDNDDLLKFRIYKLEGILFFKKADDINAVKCYQAAGGISDKFKIDDKEWLDLRALWLESLLYLDDFNALNKVINEVEKRFSLEVSNILHDINLTKIAIYKLKIKCYENIEKQDFESSKLILEELNNFILHIDRYVYAASDEDALNLSNLYLNIYGLKYLMINHLHEISPTGNFKVGLLQAVEKEKANKLFYNKFNKLSEDKYDLEKLRVTGISEMIDPNSTGVLSSQLKDTLVNISELYYDLHFGDGIYFLDRVKDYCEKYDVTFIEYIFSFEGDWALKIDKNGLMKYELDYLSEFPKAYKEITNPENDSIFNKANQLLYQTYFLPIENDVITEKVIIISEGFIDNISFDSFLSQTTNDFLVNSFIFNRAYSIKNLLISEKAGFNLSENDKVIAYSYSDVQTLKKNDPNGKNEIIGSYEECLQLEEILGNQLQIVSGFAATKTHFLQNALNKDVIHFALHGSGSDKSIKANHIYFRGDEKDEIVLKSEDIERLRFDCSLLVLNSCESNSARQIINQGNFSMARSFAKAGIENIITSTWLISDYSSTEIISKLYVELKSGKDVSKSLSLAKRSYLQTNRSSKFAHPFYWSSLVHYVN